MNRHPPPRQPLLPLDPAQLDLELEAEYQRWAIPDRILSHGVVPCMLSAAIRCRQPKINGAAYASEHVPCQRLLAPL